MIPKSMKIKCHGTPKNRFPLINEPAADLHEITIVNHHYVSSLARHVGLGSSAVTANLIQFSNFDDKQHTTPHVISTRGCCFLSDYKLCVIHNEFSLVKILGKSPENNQFKIENLNSLTQSQSVQVKLKPLT